MMNGFSAISVACHQIRESAGGLSGSDPRLHQTAAAADAQIVGARTEVLRIGFGRIQVTDPAETEFFDICRQDLRMVV